MPPLPRERFSPLADWSRSYDRLLLACHPIPRRAAPDADSPDGTIGIRSNHSLRRQILTTSILSSNLTHKGVFGIRSSRGICRKGGSRGAPPFTKPSPGCRIIRTSPPLRGARTRTTKPSPTDETDHSSGVSGSAA
jgi:hypothetical protein